MNIKDLMEKYQVVHGIENDEYRLNGFVADLLQLIEAQTRVAPSVHTHNWVLGHYAQSCTLIGSGRYRPAFAHFVCECGEFKTVTDKRSR